MPSSNVIRFFELHREVPGFYELDSATLMEFFIDCVSTQGPIFHGDIMEIGTYMGRSARHLAMHVQEGQTLYLCDPIQQIVQVTEEVQKLCAGTVKGFYNFSYQLTEADIPSKSVRFAYLDGEHGKNAIQADLTIADRVLRAEGVAILDDFMNPEFMGVTIGAIEWLTKNPGRFEIILASPGKGVLVRPGFVQFYLRLVREYIHDFHRECGCPEIMISRSSWASDCVTVGLVPQREGLEFYMRETDLSEPDVAKRVKLSF